MNRLIKNLFFILFRDEFERSNKQKIDELFNYIHKIISYNYNTAMQILKQCKGEQKSQIDSTIVFKIYFITLKLIRKNCFVCMRN